MSQVKAGFNATAKAKLAAYRAEILRSRITTATSFVVVLFITALFLMMISGGRYENILAVFGLKSIQNEAGGVYADCSKEINKNNPYCIRQNQQTEKTWQQINKSGGASSPFTLYPQ